jgi:hypothetical protein
VGNLVIDFSNSIANLNDWVLVDVKTWLMYNLYIVGAAKI